MIETPRRRSRSTIIATLALPALVLAGASVAAAAPGQSSVSAARGASGKPVPPTTTATATTTLSVDGDVYVGDGWSMTIPATWQSFPSAATVIPPIRSQFFWGTGPATATFGSNVNVLVEQIPSPISMDDYLALNLTNLANPVFGLQDVAIIGSSQIQIEGGPLLGRIDYTFTDATAGAVHALVIFTEVDGGYAVATFGAPAENFAAEVAPVEPALLTLAASSDPPTVPTTTASSTAPTTTASPPLPPESIEPTAVTTVTTTIAVEGDAYIGDGWSMTIPATWQSFPSPVDVVSPVRSEFFWATGPATATFGSNVNVLVEQIPTPISMDDYLALSLSNLTNPQFGLQDVEIIGSSQIQIKGGPLLGRVDYTFTDATAGALHALAIFTEVEGGYAVATFVAPAENFAAEVAPVESVMLTLATSTAPPTVPATTTAG